jgi:hypothetical protein
VDSTPTQRREQWLTKKKNKMPKPNKPRFSGQVKGAAKTAQSAKVQQTLSTPQVGQRPGQVATVYAPDVTPPTPTPPTPTRTTPKIKGVGQGIRVAGENGLGKNDFNRLLQKLRVIILRRSSVNSIRSTLN